jgi:hypothetical protein
MEWSNVVHLAATDASFLPKFTQMKAIRQGDAQQEFRTSDVTAGTFQGYRIESRGIFLTEERFKERFKIEASMVDSVKLIQGHTSEGKPCKGVAVANPDYPDPEIITFFESSSRMVENYLDSAKQLRPDQHTDIFSKLKKDAEKRNKHMGPSGMLSFDALSRLADIAKKKVAGVEVLDETDEDKHGSGGDDDDESSMGVDDINVMAAGSTFFDDAKAKGRSKGKGKCGKDQGKPVKRKVDVASLAALANASASSSASASGIKRSRAADSPVGDAVKQEEETQAYCGSVKSVGTGVPGLEDTRPEGMDKAEQWVAKLNLNDILMGEKRGVQLHQANRICKLLYDNQLHQSHLYLKRHLNIATMAEQLRPDALPTLAAEKRKALLSHLVKSGVAFPWQTALGVVKAAALELMAAGDTAAAVKICCPFSADGKLVPESEKQFDIENPTLAHFPLASSPSPVTAVAAVIYQVFLGDVLLQSLSDCSKGKGAVASCLRMMAALESGFAADSFEETTDQLASPIMQAVKDVMVASRVVICLLDPTPRPWADSYNEFEQLADEKSPLMNLKMLTDTNDFWVAKRDDYLRFATWEQTGGARLEPTLKALEKDCSAEAVADAMEFLADASGNLRTGACHQLEQRLIAHVRSTASQLQEGVESATASKAAQLRAQAVDAKNLVTTLHETIQNKEVESLRREIFAHASALENRLKMEELCALVETGVPDLTPGDDGPQQSQHAFASFLKQLRGALDACAGLRTQSGADAKFDKLIADILDAVPVPLIVIDDDSTDSAAEPVLGTSALDDAAQCLECCQALMKAVDFLDATETHKQMLQQLSALSTGVAMLREVEAYGSMGSCFADRSGATPDLEKKIQGLVKHRAKWVEVDNLATAANASQVLRLSKNDIYDTIVAGQGKLDAYVKEDRDAMVKVREQALSDALQVLTDIAGGREGGGSWKSDLPKKASWETVQETAARTLGQGCGSLDVKFAAAKKAFLYKAQQPLNCF